LRRRSRARLKPTCQSLCSSLGWTRSCPRTQTSPTLSFFAGAGEPCKVHALDLFLVFRGKHYAANPHLFDSISAQTVGCISICWVRHTWGKCLWAQVWGKGVWVLRGRRKERERERLNEFLRKDRCSRKDICRTN